MEYTRCEPGSKSVANELVRKKNGRGDSTYSGIALEVVRHHAFRRGLTHKIATVRFHPMLGSSSINRSVKTASGGNSPVQNQSQVRSKPWIHCDNIGEMNLTLH